MTSDGVPPGEHVYALFAQQARATPGAVAVIDRDAKTTYRELALRAEAIARRLVRAHLAPEQPVGVLMERRAELLAALLGVWKAGGAYVPLDPKIRSSVCRGSWRRPSAGSCWGTGFASSA